MGCLNTEILHTLHVSIYDANIIYTYPFTLLANKTYTHIMEKMVLLVFVVLLEFLNSK